MRWADPLSRGIILIVVCLSVIEYSNNPLRLKLVGRKRSQVKREIKKESKVDTVQRIVPSHL